ncbi:MAG: hypothetical protein R3B84_12580 [Zavarzinella sp.]
MKEHYDPWLVRLPDGRTISAKSTAAVRRHMEHGVIPKNSMARRSPEDEWRELEWIAEFADLIHGGPRLIAPEPRPLPKEFEAEEESITSEEAKPHHATPPPLHRSGSSSSNTTTSTGMHDPLRLQSVGVRGLVDELLTAFDAALKSHKLLTSALWCAVVAFTIVILGYFAFRITEAIWLTKLITYSVSLAAAAGLFTLISKQAHEEATTAKRVSPMQAIRGIVPEFVQVLLIMLAIYGGGFLVLYLLNLAPEQISKLVSNLSDNLASIVTTLLVIVLKIISIVVVLIMLLGTFAIPIRVVEQANPKQIISDWIQLLKVHRQRALIYQAGAIMTSLVAAIPTIIPIYLTMSFGPSMPRNESALSTFFPIFTQAFDTSLYAFAFGPALGYYIVANLYIYLHLRYEHSDH